jgi:uncharacterized membrane protein
MRLSGLADFISIPLRSSAREGGKTLVSIKYVAGLVAGVVFVSAGAYFYSNVDFWRAISAASGMIGLIVTVVSLVGIALNHGSEWVRDNVVVPIAATDFFIAKMTAGRTKPVSIEALSKNPDIDAEWDAVTATFGKLLKKKKPS